ncbi:MAG TPA: ribose 5-phosphate isomerase B [Candidatus Fimivivens faecavium]|nr:ribose 5-phosphate isomerase B [Candidatus Fimivivens faecavium]
MIIALGSDHGGFQLKEEIKGHLTAIGMEFRDFGTLDGASCDYPDIAEAVAKAVASGEYDRGLLFCGTGIGISIAANKVKGIRAACCSDCFSAKYTRLHNDANILCLGGRVVGPGLATEMVDLFLETKFEGGRHEGRIDKIRKIEENEM